jgi:16S rRNA (guanine527-N7)-methyltransferase
VPELKNKQLYEQLYQLQEEYNAHTNITRINSKEDYYQKHILDSLALIELIPPNSTLIDVGSGGGYPGIPLAIERPDLKITLNDTIQKKTNYLESVSQKLSLKNITVIKARAEELGQNKLYRETFDTTTARAVAEIRVLLELLSPLIKVGGYIYIMKAKNYLEELKNSENAQKELSAKLLKIENYAIEGIERVILVFQKGASTPPKYPRKPGTPEKKPL